MVTRQPDRSVSRRAALAGLGAGGLCAALAATARGVDAQGTAVEAHPIVGAWYFDFDPANPGTLFVYTIYHADGTRVDVHPFAGTGIGAWTATGERTGESILKYQNIAVAPGDFVQGNVTVWESFTVDVSGNGVTGDAVVELRAADGTVVALFPFTATIARLVVEPPPPLATPEAATPTT